MLYYYLDGLEKKGPYSSEELRSRNVHPETMVFANGMANWTAIKDLPELCNQLFGNVLNDETKKTSAKDSIQKHSPQTNIQPDKNKKIVIPALLFLILGIIAAFGLSYLYVQHQKQKDWEKMNSNINFVFQGEDQVCDRLKSGLSGVLKKSDSSTPTDNDGKKLVEYYECSSGGFSVITLTKMPDGYNCVEIFSKNLGYKVPSSQWVPRVDYGYGLYSKGYSAPNNRVSLQAAYNAAMEHLTSEKENNSFMPGSYNRIKYFGEIRTDFYSMVNFTPSGSYSETTNRIEPWVSSSDATVQNNQYIIWYHYIVKHYEIRVNKKALRKIFLIYSLIGSLLAFLIYFLIRYRRRITLQVT